MWVCSGQQRYSGTTCICSNEFLKRKERFVFNQFSKGSTSRSIGKKLFCRSQLERRQWKKQYRTRQAGADCHLVSDLDGHILRHASKRDLATIKKRFLVHPLQISRSERNYPGGQVGSAPLLERSLYHRHASLGSRRRHFLHGPVSS